MMRNATGSIAFAFGIVLLSTDCGGQGGANDPGPADLADVPDEVQADLPGEEASPDADAVDPCSYAAVPKSPPDPTRTKFALTMFHWNTQYVAGGLVSTWEGLPVTACGLLFGDDALCEGWTDDVLVDWILQQSFEPILDMYLDHPGWKATFECPGIMIEAMEARHPVMLAKLQGAVLSGQVEMVSFHWSDQLFLAYPARDLEKSLELNDRVFQRTCLPVSPVVFNQEGQSGPGKHSFMARHGFTIDVLHENLFRYFQWGTTPWPVYTDRGVTVLAGMEEGLKDGPGVDPSSGIQVVWPFFDDGEVLATPGNPYLAPVISRHDPAQVATYEALLQAYADQGYTISSIAGYVADLAAREVEFRPLPAIADSTWQPIDTEGIHQWMGRHGGLGDAWPYERDNDHRTATYRTSQAMAAAGVLLDAAADGGKDVGAIRESLDDAWRNLLKAEVSDATGINPWPGEFVYGMSFNDAASSAAEAAIASLLALLGWPHALVDVGAGTANRLDDLPVAEPPDPADPPLEVTVDAPSRAVEVRWYKSVSDSVQMHVLLGPMADPSKPADEANRRVIVAFPRFEDMLRYTPGLSEDEVVEQPLHDFTLQDGRLYLPLSNGLIGLGNDWWVIKHCTTVHLAAEVSVAGETDFVRFVDQTAIPDESRTWVFTVFRGSKEDALALARRLNTHPVVMR